MKGLLLKDLYMMRAYCRAYLLVTAVFLAASLFGENMFFVYYPCLMCGVIPVNLLAYDERNRFLQYSAALPVSRKQQVTEKYLVGFLSQASVLLLTGIVQTVKMKLGGTLAAASLAPVLLSVALVSLVAVAIPLPFIFKEGVEKGRIAYYVMIGMVCGVSILLSNGLKDSGTVRIPAGPAFVILTAAVLGLFVLSWYLSVLFFERREI